MKRIAVLLGALLFGFEGMALPPLQIAGPEILAGGKPIRLRGINWGWWREHGTRYTEEDMKNQAQWGANVVRLTFSYHYLLDENGQWSEERLKPFDEVVTWAERYEQYVILDMHELPGGQSPVAYCERGANAFWRDGKAQEQWIGLWKKLALRYKNIPAVAAYELMNEPQPPKDFSTAEMMALYRRIIREIRSVDAEKILVVSGNHMSDARGMTDEVKVDDPHILYTFHFYHSWLGNLGETARQETGDQDWTLLELPFELDDTVSRINLLLRSTGNSGSALFDDVTLEDEHGTVLLRFGFDRGRDGFEPERLPHASMSYEPRQGHLAPGALRVSGTESYNSFQFRWIRSGSARKFKFKAYRKLENATGSSYIAVSQFGWKTPDKLRQALETASRFQAKFQVPVWVGEFGITCDVPALQKRAVEDHIRIFEEYKFHWTYWNFHETTNPNQMALQAQKRSSSENYPLNAFLLEALRDGWQHNRSGEKN